MTAAEIIAEPLTPGTFFAFGDVLEAKGGPTMMINDGRCGRFHDICRLSFEGGNAGISLFRSEASRMPYKLTLMERHPVGSQTFIPITAAPYIVVVANDDGGRPVEPRAFFSRADQGVNYLKNVWHAPLIALEEGAVFAVIDRIGPDDNLQEHRMEHPVYVIDCEPF